MAQHDPAKTPNWVPSAVTLEMHSNVSILEDMCSLEAPLEFTPLYRKIWDRGIGGLLFMNSTMHLLSYILSRRENVRIQ